MGDILFRCKACSKNLAIEEAGAGGRVRCTDCGCAVVVPAPVLDFACPSCRCALRASDAVKGSPFQCPNCGVEVLVPRDTTTRVIDWHMDAKAGESAAPPSPHQVIHRLRYPAGNPVSTNLWMLGSVVASVLFGAVLLYGLLVGRGVLPKPAWAGAWAVTDRAADDEFYARVLTKYALAVSQPEKPVVLRSYLNAFPEGRHAGAVRALLDREDDQLFDYARVRFGLSADPSNRVASILTYTRRFPRGRHIGAANGYLDHVRAAQGR